MKPIYYLFAALISFATFTACDDDDDIKTPQKEVPASALSRVSDAYPTAHVTWEREYGKIKAEVKNNGEEIDMWFNTDGTWLGTERDYYGALPEAIVTYISTNYSGYVIDDVDFWETPNGNYYELELERSGKRDVVIRINDAGTIVPPAF